MIFKLFKGAATSITFVCLTFVSFNTNAALIDITASSTDTRLNGFTLRFDDFSGDGLLQIDEVVQFSGFTLTNPANSAVNGLYDVIIGTPDIAGVSASSGIPLFASSNWNFKRFPGDNVLCCSSQFWTYNSSEVIFITETITAVPVPAAFWLFFSGFISLAGLIRKRGCNT